MIDTELENQIADELKIANAELEKLKSELKKLKIIESRSEAIIEKDQVRSLHRLVDYSISEVSTDYNSITSDVRSSEREALEFTTRPRIKEIEIAIVNQREKIEKLKRKQTQFEKISSLKSAYLSSDYELIISGESCTLEEIKKEMLIISSLNVLKEKVTKVVFQEFEVGIILADVVGVIKYLAMLKKVVFQHTFLINSEVADIWESLKALNLSFLSFAHNLIDIPWMLSSPPDFTSTIKVDLSHNVMRPERLSKSIDGVSTDIVAKIPQAVFKEIGSTKSYLNEDMKISDDNWAVYILASKSSFLCPSHASIVIEGVNSDGFHVFTRAHLRPKLPCTSVTGIFFSICHNFDILVEYINADSVKQQLLDIQSRNIYFGFHLKKENALLLLKDITKDCEKVDGRFSLLPGTEINNGTTKTLTCLRWILNSVNKYRVAEGKEKLTGERPYATVEKYQGLSDEIELTTMGGSYAYT